MAKLVKSDSHVAQLRRRVALRQLFSNASVLLVGNFGASLLGLVSLALTARALGTENFGVLVLISTYVLLIDRLVNFQSWQAVIKYGAKALSANSRPQDFLSLVKFGLLLDITTAAVGAIVAVATVWAVGTWLGWSEQYVWMASAYGLTVLFHVSGTPIAILRLHGEFGRAAVQNVVASSVKLVGVVISYVAEAGLPGFLAAWAVTDILGKLILVQFARGVLVREGHRGIRTSNVAGLSQRFPGIWQFLWSTNLHSSVKLGLREADVLIVGGLLGAAGAGLYKIVKTIGSTLSRLAEPLYQAVYPEMAKAIALKQADSLSHLLTAPLRYVAPAGVLALLCFALAGEYVIVVLLGDEYAGAYLPSLIYLVGAVLGAATFSFHPAMLSLGRAKLSLAILAVSTFVYLFALWVLTQSSGLVGASASYVLFYMIWASLQWFYLSRLIQREGI